MAGDADLQSLHASSSTASILWPVSTEAGWVRARNGVALSVATAAGIGSILGLARDTAPGSFAVTTAINTSVAATAWFAVRELVVSPVLVKAGVTEEARRRYQGVLLERELRSGPLEDQSWNSMRTDRILDTGLTSAIFFAVGPPLYQELKARVSELKPVRNPLSFTLGSAAVLGLGSAFGQWAANELRIHDWRKYGAYDAFGPIPDVDILKIRKAQREELVASIAGEVHPAVAAREAVRQKKAEAERKAEEELKASGTVSATELIKRRRPPFSWDRFVQEAMPWATALSAQETLDRLEKEADGWRLELAQVRKEMAEIGLAPTPEAGRWAVDSPVDIGNERTLEGYR